MSIFNQLRSSADRIQQRTGWHTFVVCTGGRPTGADDMREVLVNEQTVQRYKTVRHGYAYSWSAEIECQPTGRTKDIDTFNGTIRYTEYSTPDSVKFWYGYGAGTPEHFDYGVFRLTEPK